MLGDRKSLGDHDKALRKDRTSVKEVKAKNEEGSDANTMQEEKNNKEKAALYAERKSWEAYAKRIARREIIRRGKDAKSNLTPVTLN